MRKLLLSASSASLAALSLLAPAHAQAFPSFNPGDMGQLDRMCNHLKSSSMTASNPFGGDSVDIDGTRWTAQNCANALAVYEKVSMAGIDSAGKTARAMAAAQSQSAMIGGIGSIFSSLISNASNRSSSNQDAQQAQIIAAQQQQIQELKQMILAQNAAQQPSYQAQQTQFVQQPRYSTYQNQGQPQRMYSNQYSAGQSTLRQTNLF